MDDGSQFTNRSEMAEMLTASWYRSLELASPLPLEEERVKSALSSAAQLALAALTEGDGGDRLFAEGRAIAEAGDFPFAAAIALQRAWAEAVADHLSADGERLATAVDVGARLALGFLEGVSLQRKRASVRATRRMGHDLKTPLNAVTGFSRVILKGIDGPITDFQREDLSSIYQAGQDLLAMIESMVEVAKRDAAGEVIEVATVDVPLLVGNLIATLQPILAARNNRLTLHLNGRLGRVHAPLMEVRWMVLAPLLCLNRLISEGEIILEVARRGVDESILVWNYVTEAVDAATLEKVAEHDVGMMALRRFARELDCSLSFAQLNGRCRCVLEMPFPALGEEA